MNKNSELQKALDNTVKRFIPNGLSEENLIRLGQLHYNNNAIGLYKKLGEFWRGKPKPRSKESIQKGASKLRGITRSLEFKKKLSEIAKKRRKPIHKTLENPKASLILLLLQEGSLSYNQIIKKTKCSHTLFYRVKTFFDGGKLKKVDMVNNHPQRGKKLSDEQIEKIKVGLLNKPKDICPYCSKEFTRPTDLENHINKKHKKKLKELARKKEREGKIIWGDKIYMTPLQCREWLWGMGFFRGYDDPKYKSYVKNGGDLPKGFRTFPWVSEAETNSRFFNKRLIEQDKKIEVIKDLYQKGHSIRLISEETEIPPTTVKRILDKHKITSNHNVGFKQKITHEKRQTKKGRPPVNFTLKELKDHNQKYKCRTTRDFIKTKFKTSLSNIYRIFPQLNWNSVKYKNEII